MKFLHSIIKLSFVFIIIEARVITENSSKKYKTENDKTEPTNSTDKEIAEHKEVFSYIDMDNDGNITNTVG